MVGTSRDIIDRWNRVIAKVTADNEQKILIPQGMELAAPSGEPPEVFAAFLARDRANYVRIKNEARLKTD